MTASIEPSESASPYAPPRAPVADIPSNEANIRIEYTQTWRDVLLFNSLSQLLSPVSQAFNLLMAGGGCYYFLRNRGLAAYLIAVPISYACILLSQIAINLLGLVAQKANFTTHTLEIREDGLFEQTAINSSLQAWQGGIARVVSRGGFVAVYINSYMMHIIPPRAFENEAHRAGFVETIRRKIGS